MVKSIEIDAPQDQVFAYAVDLERQPEWIVFLKEIEVTSGDGKSEGTTDRSVIKLGPRTRILESEWTEYRPNESFARRATTGMQMQGRMAFTPLNEGTRIQWSIDYKPPMGLLGAVIDVLFMNRVFQNEIEESLEKLRAALEG